MVAFYNYNFLNLILCKILNIVKDSIIPNAIAKPMDKVNIPL